MKLEVKQDLDRTHCHCFDRGSNTRYYTFGRERLTGKLSVIRDFDNTHICFTQNKFEFKFKFSCNELVITMLLEPLDKQRLKQYQ